MIIQPLKKLREKLGKYYTPLLFLLFFVIFFLILSTSVKQRDADYREGQVANESIRANKTIENTNATEQKRTLAAEAVAPEYTFQEDLADTQKNRLTKLFSLVDNVKTDLDKKRDDKAKADNNPKLAKVSSDEYIAGVKKLFEKLNEDDLEFYQKIPNDFYERAFAMSSTDRSALEEACLNVLDNQMETQIRESTLSEAKAKAKQEIDTLQVSDDVKAAAKDLMDQFIVVNDVLNEKRTERLQQQARDAVSPVMILQGEVIVREGSQIDATSMEKLKLLGLTSHNQSLFPFVAMVLAILIQMLAMIYFARQFHTKDHQQEFLSFYAAAMVFSLILMKFFQIFQTESIAYIPLFYPAAFVPLILNSFLNRRAGILAAMFQVVAAIFIYYDTIGTTMLPIILVSYTFSGLMGTIVRRERISRQGWSAVTWLIIFPFMMTIVLAVFQGLSLTDGKTWTMLIISLAGLVFGFFLAMGLYQYIELLVSDDSAIVLNELSNPNHPLLKQLLEEAPGTYHHSMMVANLSANAVAEIGGRSLLTRVACYYHDIGKLKHANFFVENLPDGAENPHNFLLPEDSKQIIFGHVIDGAKVLEEYKMPQMVIDICWQHHGTTLMKYFYAKAKERDPEIQEKDYRYPGPKPQTREAGVVSIADSCEAAVRAMDHPTNEKIQKFVHNLISDRILDGQLTESGLTLGELAKVEQSLINGLCSTFHSRIKYPKMKSEAEKMKEEQERSEK